MSADLKSACRDAALAAREKSAASLSPAERFAIAYLAGVPVVSDHPITLAPFAIIKDPTTGRFHVFHETPAEPTPP